MAPERFRLQTVLDVKQRLEDVQQQELAALAQQRQLAEEALRLLAQQAEEQQNALAQRVADGRIDLTDVQAALAYIEAVRVSIAAQRDRASELEQKVRESRERLAGIARERHMLELLRDRHGAAALAAADQLDQRAADELVGQRFARRAWEA
jgi:flagellar export protein FliJ